MRTDHRCSLSCVQEGRSGLYCGVTMRTISTSAAKSWKKSAEKKQRWEDRLWKVKAGEVAIVALPGKGYRAPTATRPYSEGLVEIAIENGPFHYESLGSLRSNRAPELRRLLETTWYETYNGAKTALKEVVKRIRKVSYSHLPDEHS